MSTEVKLSGIVIGRPGIFLSGGRGGSNPWGSLAADSSDSTLLSSQDRVVAVYDGGSYLYYGKSGSIWKLLWVDRNGALLRGDTAGTYQVTVAGNGPAPFDAAYGTATDRLAGSISAGTTFNHAANFVLEATIVAIPGNGSAAGDIRFRAQDSDDFWRSYWNHTGLIVLSEVVAGSDTSRGSASGVLSSGHRIVVVADGSAIRIYSNGTLRITYASASNFTTETDGLVYALGSLGGAISDLVAWPRTPSGAAAYLLNRVAA